LCDATQSTTIAPYYQNIGFWGFMLQNHVEIIKGREHFNNRTKNCQLKQDNTGWGKCLAAKGGGRAHRR